MIKFCLKSTCLCARIGNNSIQIIKIDNISFLEEAEDQKMKIICVALNPAMDKTIFVSDFKLGGVNVIDETYYELGGRGINVARVLNHFGIKSIVTGFVGGIWAETFRIKLMKLGIETKFFKLMQDTRVNTKLIDKTSGECTTISEKGPFVPEELLEKFIQSFTIMCKEGDIIILSGGVLPGIPDDIYCQLTTIAKEKGAYVILDHYGPVLKSALSAKPDVVKVTYKDYIPEEYWGKLTKADFGYIINQVKDIDAEKVLISLGEKGAILIENHMTYYANSINVGIQLKHPVGAGDAMVAALVKSKLENMSPVASLKLAVACGAVCVMAQGVTNFAEEQVIKLLPKADVENMIMY